MLPSSSLAPGPRSLPARPALPSACSHSLTTLRARPLPSPLLTGTAGSARTIAAAGHLALGLPIASGNSTLSPGLGAALNLSAASLNLNSFIALPGGSLSATATSGNLSLGGRIDVSGQSRSFYDPPRFPDAGSIPPNSPNGVVILTPPPILSPISHRPLRYR